MTELEKIADKLGFTLIYNKDSDNDPLFNNMSVAGYTIWVGDYENKEFELISFFHEYGHHLVGHDTFAEKWNYNTLMVEIECWNRGLEAARNMGYLFSDKAVEWGFGRAMTYVGNDERECSKWSEGTGANLWINREKE